MTSEANSNALTDYLRRLGIPVEADGSFVFVDGKTDWGQVEAIKRMCEQSGVDLLQPSAPTPPER